MPVYEYQCSQCKHKFDLKRPMSQAHEDAPCPRCQSQAKRVFSTAGSFAKDMSELPSSWRKT